jgi:hypothetical protein
MGATLWTPGFPNGLGGVNSTAGGAAWMFSRSSAFSVNGRRSTSSRCSMSVGSRFCRGELALMDDQNSLLPHQIVRTNPPSTGIVAPDR